MEPFARRGRLARFAGYLFQPGWPGAVLFLVLAEFIFAGTLRWITKDLDDAVEVMAVALMAGAAVMTPPLVWRVFRLPTKHTLIIQTLFLGLCAGLMVMVDTLGDVLLGQYYSTALLPPFGFFAMLDGGLTAGRETGWLLVGLATFAIVAGLLLLLSWRYWATMNAHGRAICSTPKRVPMPLEVAA